MNTAKMIQFIKNPRKILLALAVRRLWPMSDTNYLKYRYFEKLHKELDLISPKTFNEKLQWLKLYDQNPIYTTMVDKYAVKKYISDITGGGTLCRQ